MAPSPSNLEDRLANWGRAMRVSRGRGRALSFEGNYRSPQRNHWEIPISSLHRSIDSQDAWKIEAAWASLEPLNRILLRGRYCLRLAPQRICRVAARETGQACGIHAFEQRMADAVEAIGKALERTPAQNYNILRSAVSKILDLVHLRAYKDI